MIKKMYSCLSARNQRLKYPSAKHARILLSEGKRGCPGPSEEIKVLTFLFICLVLNLFDRGVQWFISGKTSSGGKGSTIFQGVQLLIHMEQ